MSPNRHAGPRTVLSCHSPASAARSASSESRSSTRPRAVQRGRGVRAVQHPPGRRRQVLAHRRRLGEQDADLERDRVRRLGQLAASAPAGRRRRRATHAAGTARVMRCIARRPAATVERARPGSCSIRERRPRPCGRSPRPAPRPAPSRTARRRRVSAPTAKSTCGSAARRTAPPCGRAPTRPSPRTPSGTADRRPARARARAARHHLDPCRRGRRTSAPPPTPARTSADEHGDVGQRAVAVGRDAGAGRSTAADGDAPRPARSRRRTASSTTPVPWALASATPPPGPPAAARDPARADGGSRRPPAGRCDPRAGGRARRSARARRACAATAAAGARRGRRPRRGEAELHREIRVVDVRRMVDAAGEHDDARARLGDGRRARAQLRRERAIEATRDVASSSADDARHHRPVEQRVAEARRRVGEVLHDVPLAVRRA